MSMQKKLIPAIKRTYVQEGEWFDHEIMVEEGYDFSLSPYEPHNEDRIPAPYCGVGSQQTIIEVAQ